MANYEATRYNFDGGNLSDIEGVNTGIVLPWSSASVPTGFLECDGTAVSRTTYSALFAVIGTTWGTGDGSTTFNLPDFTDRCCVSASPTKTFASTGGANSVTSTGNVSGSLGNTTIDVPTLAPHSHGQGGASYGGNRYEPPETSSLPSSGGSSGSTGGSGAHSHPLAATFSGDATDVLQPYLTVMYVIKT